MLHALKPTEIVSLTELGEYRIEVLHGRVFAFNYGGALKATPTKATKVKVAEPLHLLATDHAAIVADRIGDL